jgi:hypothetical protein
MIPRPILLVKSPACGGVPMHVDCEGALVREGYFVLHTDKLDCMRVLAPCPFTQADVDTLKYPGGDPVALTVALDSIADRIAGLLAQEAAR